MFVEDVTAHFRDWPAVDATLAGRPVRGILEGGYELARIGQIGMDSSSHAFTLASADVGTKPGGATLVIGSETYTVVGHEPDGTGISRLILRAA